MIQVEIYNFMGVPSFVPIPSGLIHRLALSLIQNPLHSLP